MSDLPKVNSRIEHHFLGYIDDVKFEMENIFYSVEYILECILDKYKVKWYNDEFIRTLRNIVTSRYHSGEELGDIEDDMKWQIDEHDDFRDLKLVDEEEFNKGIESRLFMLEEFKGDQNVKFIKS